MDYWNRNVCRSFSNAQINKLFNKNLYASLPSHTVDLTSSRSSSLTHTLTQSRPCFYMLWTSFDSCRLYEALRGSTKLHANPPNNRWKVWYGHCRKSIGQSEPEDNPWAQWDIMSVRRFIAKYMGSHRGDLDIKQWRNIMSLSFGPWGN